MQVQRKVIDVSDTQVVLELPASFLNHRVEVIALTMDEGATMTRPRRVPSALIAGKGRTIGDLVAPIVDASEWAEMPRLR